MKNTVVAGAQFGDEGKAKITDLLASKADIIIRYQGGCNAGHTVVHEGVTYKFHLIPSGILYNDKICFIGAGTVISPDDFENEISELKANGLSDESLKKSLKISPLAHITMPYHKITDGKSESSLGKNKIGTTGKGIGPTYTDKYARCGLRIEDLFDDKSLAEKVDVILSQKNKILKNVYGADEYTSAEILELLAKYKKLFEPFVCFEWQELFRKIKQEKKTILFEGAQGVLLDIDYGTYPYVTSSNPIAGGAGVGAGMGPLMIEDVVGVFKAYVTRVGEGPFVTELLDETGDTIRNVGGEFGTTTGRPRRCGWFDAVLAKYSALVCGISSLAITKADIFDDFDEIKICTAYKNKNTGEITESYPTNFARLSDYEPVYETMQGWHEKISDVKNYEDLPKNAKIYFKKLEELTGVPIKIISVGPDREQTIFID